MNKYVSKAWAWIKAHPVIVAGVVGFIIGFVATSALASTGNLTYTRPTTRADGSPLAAADIASYRINCTYTPTGGVAAACVSLTPTSFGGASLGGAVTFVVSASGQACFTLQTVDTGGQSSVPSTSACKAVVVSVPNPPTNVVVAFNVTINGQTVRIDPVPAFGVSATNKRLSTVYGFVNAGTPCIGDELFTYRGHGYRRVARADVGWWRTTATDNVAAPCAAGA